MIIGIESNTSRSFYLYGGLSGEYAVSASVPELKCVSEGAQVT